MLFYYKNVVQIGFSHLVHTQFLSSVVCSVKKHSIIKSLKRFINCDLDGDLSHTHLPISN